MNPLTQISESTHMDWLIKSQRFGISHLVIEVIAPHIVEDLLQVEVLDKEGQLIPGLAAHYEAVIMRHLLKVFPAKRQSYSVAHYAVIGFYESVAQSLAVHAATHKAPPDSHEVASHVVKGFALVPFQHASATFLNSFQNYLKAHLQFTGSLADAMALNNKIDAEIKKGMVNDKTFTLLRVVSHLHKVSTSLVRTYRTIAVEDLKIRNMTRNAVGTVSQPNLHSSAKRGLNRVIQKQAWGVLFRMLEYKCAWYGRTFIKVDPKNTSRTCPQCGHIAKENRESQAVFRCVGCGHTANADLVGALNVLRRGLGSQATIPA